MRSKNTSISDIRYLAIKGSEYITEAERRIKANKFVDRRDFKAKSHRNRRNKMTKTISLLAVCLRVQLKLIHLGMFVCLTVKMKILQAVVLFESLDGFEG